MKITLKKIAWLAMLILFLASTTALAGRYLARNREADASRRAQAIAAGSTASSPTAGPENSETAAAASPTEAAYPQDPWIPAPVEDDPVMEEMAAIDIAALQAVNPDVVGWIRIPDTRVDYPLLQGEDNQFYLEHTWEREPNFAGSIFLESRSSPELTDFNTIIYGHNMTSGSMFGTVSDYRKMDTWLRHPYVYIALPDGVFRYEIFASYEAPIDAPTYGLSFNQLQTRLDFLTYALENSVYDTGIVPAVSDRIVTLSTCTGVDYDSRWVIQGRLPMILKE